MFCAQGDHDKFYAHDQIDWHTIYMLLPKQLDPIECKIINRNPNGTESANIHQFYCNGSVTCFDRLSSQVQVEKKQTFFTVAKLYTVDVGVFVGQPNNYDSITNTETSKSRCEDDNEYLIDKDSWSLIIEEIFLD